MHKTATVILAAGSSTRLGLPKQLLAYNGKTLLQHAIDEAAKAGADPIVVVLGFKAEEISETIKRNNVELFINAGWEQGMASGISGGVGKALQLDEKLEQLIITVCDQPFVTASLFNELKKVQRETQQHIVACAYADTIGTPVLFTKKYFSHLQALTGEEGAKKIVKTNMDDVAAVEFSPGEIDIDTVDDYDGLVQTE
ncbi:nucleotidyltransferase family protein [Danxiaibacter flavus]|uniref:Nucleotidyltransferase family protein n=1 Tax=Danxiaibacter flavus TaxID=3049108 RepID=A0ABV3ZI66_9BACT|nr:nucleotidyltransferase family protein [Chitinophagaceae bacterium DXS]